jgi:predicted DNA-binding protein with PD1-like motif
VQSAWLSGLGAALSAELGYYDLDSREYHWQTITEPMEVTSISGNIAKKDDEIRLHLHATLAGQDYKAIGGHVNKLITGGTVEIIVQPLSSSLLRARDEQTGLDLLRDS